MRRHWMCAPMIALCLLLPSCGGETGNAAEELALEIRGEYLSMAGCTARAELTADYGQRVYTYGLDISCTQEETVLTITEPENISGVTARIQAGETVLEYDGVRVETGALNRDGLSPMDAVPALLTAAKEGFLAQSVLEGSGEEARRCILPSGTRKFRQGVGRNSSSGLQRIPMLWSGERSVRTVLP